MSEKQHKKTFNTFPFNHASLRFIFIKKMHLFLQLILIDFSLKGVFLTQYFF